MTQYECARTGQSAPKAYILKTTEGEELVGEEALFHPEADAGLGHVLADMAVRIVRLEEALLERDAQPEKGDAADDVQEDTAEPAPEEDQAPAEPASKHPAKRAAAKRTVGRQRGASD